MNSWLIEQNLSFIRQRLKWLVFGRRIGSAGTVLCLIWFLIQLCAYRGVFTHLLFFYLFATLMVVASLAALFIAALITFARNEKRSWIGNELEKGCPPLMDRVNTLIFLDENPRQPPPFRLKSRIEEQAEKVFKTQKTSSPFSPARTFAHLGLFVLMLTGVMFFQIHYDPFGSLQNDSTTTVASKPGAVFELAPQKDVSETQVKKAWGEVRIVDPGHDVRLTKVDVLPLQIEMTASDTMEKPVWVTRIDGGEESSHELPAPTDPNYMVYQPLVYIDELKVTEWDVIGYYAKVKSAAPAEYASPLSFIEIRPFREDILKLTGGKDGKQNQRYQLLSELTGLIKQQTGLLQDTHQHRETTYTNSDQRMQDAKKLSKAEGDLAGAANHFYGKIASESENTPVGAILDELSQAEEQMNRATQALQDDVAQEGEQREQGALSHLIACRKAFQKVISDHPDAFGGDSPDAIADEDTVTATESLKALSQVSEMRNRDQSALEELHQLTQRQQNLAVNPGSAVLKPQPEVDLKSDLHSMMEDKKKALATSSFDPLMAERQEMQLKSDFHGLMDRNSDLFRNSKAEQDTVQENMTQAIEKLSSDKKSEGKQAMTRAADSMRDLENALKKSLEAQQLAEAYKLKKIIEQNARQLSHEQAKPGTLSDQEVKDLAFSAQHSTSTLKDIVENDSGNSFGPKVRQALSPENQQALNNALNKFGSLPSGPDRGAAAGEAKHDLQAISDAFDQSQPDLTRKIRGEDQLQPGQGDSLNQAIQKLQSMILAAEGQHPNSPGDQAKALVEALHDLQVGMDDNKFTAAMRDKMQGEADELFKKKAPGEAVDPAALKKFLDEIESVRVEANDANRPRPPEPNTTQIDPSTFPPAYRERLKNYFEQLSQPSH